MVDGGIVDVVEGELVLTGGCDSCTRIGSSSLEPLLTVAVGMFFATERLNADADSVLAAVREHTDLRRTMLGSNLGWVLIDDSGDIIGFELVEAYPSAPSVKIDHEELEADLLALNPE